MIQFLTRQLFAFIALIFLSQSASAKCGPGGISVLSSRKTLTKNGIVILEFSAHAQEYVPGIGKKHLVYLRSGNASVLLQPVEVLKGEMLVTEIVFRPTCDLIEGDVYELQIDGLPKGVRVQDYNYETNKFEPNTFTIIAGNNSPSLAFITTPLETKRSMDVFGCGPARYVHFRISADTTIEYVRANVSNAITGKTTTYIVAVKNGEAIIGHGMCTGAFHFDDSEKFTVSFVLLDDRGNEGKISAPIAFQAPQIKDGRSR
jgi:hypothetical protein